MASQPKHGMQGQAQPEDFSGEYNSLLFIIRQVLNRSNVSALCKVTAVTGGGVATTGYVDLQPLMNQVDGYGESIPQGIFHNVPFFRLQSGVSAIIIDPVVGDIGVAVFSDRDISNIKAQHKAGNIAQVISTGALPESRRRFDVADGMFFCGFFNATPTQFIQFKTDGIVVTTNQKITVNATGGDVGITESGAVKLNATGGDVSITASGAVKLNATGNIELAAGGGTPKGIVQGDCICAYTGSPHPQVSIKVKGSL